MHRMYPEFFDSLNLNGPLSVHQPLPPHSNAGGQIANELPFPMGPSLEMSLDEHLRPLPTPPIWLSQDPFRLGQEGQDMLRIGQQPKMHLPHQQNPGSSLQHLPNRCDARVPSSDTSSSSCSPSSSENVHNALNNLLGLDGNGLPAPQMKQEPPDDYLSAMHQQMQGGENRLMPFCSSDRQRAATPQRRSRSSGEGMLKCQYCPKKFSSSPLLENHMRDCQLIRVHECAQCGKRFKARGGLQQHMRIHNNDRPYSCHFCSKRFTQKSHVDQHERIHTGTKPFHCSYCGRAFRQRSQQMGHEATHTHAGQEVRSNIEAGKGHLENAGEQRLPANNAVSGLLALSQPGHLPPNLMGMPPPNPMLHIPDFDHHMLGQMM